MLDKNSPIWGLLYLIVLGGVLYLNASLFDETEIKALLEFASIFGVMEYKRNKV